jgi:hypothetical protein
MDDVKASGKRRGGGGVILLGLLIIVCGCLSPLFPDKHAPLALTLSLVSLGMIILVQGIEAA